MPYVYIGHEGLISTLLAACGAGYDIDPRPSVFRQPASGSVHTTKPMLCLASCVQVDQTCEYEDSVMLAGVQDTLLAHVLSIYNR